MKNGEPCPLCGSDHHPWAHDLPNENVDDEQLKKKQSALDDERESLSKLKTKKENDENELKRENRELSAKKEKLEESLKRQKVLLDGLPEKVKSQNATEIIKVVDEVIDILKPEAFYKESHQHIFSAIKTLLEEGQPIDL